MFQHDVDHRHLHSFPTRRSSDLLRKSCVEIDSAGLDPAIRETLERHRGRRHVVLCTSPKVRVPTALGLFNPAIVIPDWLRSEEHTSELQSRRDLVCRLLLEKKNG